MVGRLPRPAGRTRIGKPELLKIERLNISLDRSHRVVPPHIVFNARRQKGRLFPAVAGLETVIRHKTNRTPSRQSRYEYLPSLAAKSGGRPRIPLRFMRATILGMRALNTRARARPCGDPIRR